MHSGPAAFSAAEVSEFRPLFIAIAKKQMTQQDVQTQLGREKYNRFKDYYKHAAAQVKRRIETAPSPSAVSPSPAASYSSSSSAPVLASDPNQLTDREKIIFPQLIQKLSSGAWDLAKAERYFIESKHPGFDKFMNYYQAELLKERSEAVAHVAALQEHKTLMLRGIEENNRVIEDAMTKAASHISPKTHMVKVAPR